MPRWPICGNGVTPVITPFPPHAIPWPPTSNLNCSRPALRSLRLQSATTRGKGRAAKPLYINEFLKTNRGVSPICFQDNAENQQLSRPPPTPAYAAAPNHLTHNTFPERESSNFADSLSGNTLIISNIAAASFSVRKEKLHKLNRFTEFICCGQKKARIPARTSVFRQSGQKPRKEIAAARALKAKPRRARAQRTGNAGTGPLFLGTRTCPFPGAEGNAAARRNWHGDHAGGAGAQQRSRPLGAGFVYGEKVDYCSSGALLPPP